MKQHIIIGTAGHIDHGKTALIKALTDIDTDRLKEEKERGITIELGFAYWKDNITIIDVPGHERFVKTMVAGVSTIDLFLLVIAADDGIMPQTIEHLEILKFFGVQNGLVALNKIDLVDEEWLALMQLEVEEFLKKNGFVHVPVLPVSAATGQGVEALRQVLTEKIEHCAERKSTRPFRLNVDRSFSIHGAGTVVTGTVLSDSIAVDEALEILPDQKRTKVRGLQVHQKDVQQAQIGQRAAINLVNVSKNEAERGKTMVRPDTLEPVTEFLTVLQSASQIPIKIKKHQEVRVYLGTAELLGRIYWFEEESALSPNQTYHARIRLEESGVCAPGDAVLIRTISPFYTLAGGRVLFLNPPHLSQLRDNWQDVFERLSSNNLTEQIKIFLDFNGFTSVDLKTLTQQFFETESTLSKALKPLLKDKTLLVVEQPNGPVYLFAPALEKAQAQLLAALKEAREKGQLKDGLNKKALLNLLHPKCEDELFFDRLLRRMVNRRLLIQVDDRYFTPEIANLEQRQKQSEAILQLLLESKFQALKSDQIAEKLQLPSKEVKALLTNLVKQGKLHSIAGIFYLHDQTLQKLLDFLKEEFKEKSALDIASLKNFTGLTRKLLIPLLEYLDQKQFTRRSGDKRLKGPMLN
ncbi:MAG: selenocysteine-specific translation elongation factor [Caldisericaceae bacterium]|nr:selenocysteine-specific translation elongation factor [Caldisericaceae bacterium]